ncbi:methionyl-tRNA formyltransferase [Demequina sediminicola]|uniref:methionyl-tRNA formyltransferase n=1 Tax=Demequina sediminicola TaxID=1095026 RepID=UPI0007831D38|nr:methionyl-tRNA formyltransferase [Demequina sediminicola]
MRLIFAGTPDVAVPSLEALVASPHEVIAVVTQPDARGKRGKALHASPVKVAAEAHGIEVLTPASAKDPEFIDQIKDLKADAAAVVAYGQILTRELLDSVAHGWVNLHFSVLPQWRGAAPVQRAIMAGDEFTGASAFLLEEGLDTGPVIGTLTERIRPTDTSGVLLARLAEAGAPLLVGALDALESGQASPVVQPDDGVSYAAKLNRDDAYVAWERPSHVVDRQVRGCTPAPGAWTTLPDGSVAKLGPVSPVIGSTTTVPGQVSFADGVVTVGTGTEQVALSTIAPAGKKPMDAAAWWRGARLPEGSALGEA